MSTADKTFLAGIFPGHRPRLLKSVVAVPPETLADPHSRWLYDFALTFLDRYGDVPNPNTMKAAVERRFDAGEAAKVWLVYASAANTHVPDADFDYAVEVLAEEAEKRATGQALSIAFEIFDSGYVIGNETLQGHRAAQEYLASRLTEIQRAGLVAAANEADVQSEVRDVIAEYHARKHLSEPPGIQFGIPALDVNTGGIQRGDLVLIAGFTSHGKSQMATSIAWDAAVRQGKNVFYATNETSREDIRNRYLARHSRLPQFDYPGGLDHQKIRRAALNATEEKVFFQVLEDLYYNPTYGKFHIAQIPRGATLSYVEQRMLHKHHEWGIDLAVEDYLNLLKPDRGRTTQREEASDILKDAKVLATSFAGRGVGLLSPWQISRTAYQKAQTQQYYDMDALSEASEAEKSADLILALWHNTVLDPRRSTIQMMKNRNGALVRKVECEVDYRNAYFRETDGSVPSTVLSGPTVFSQISTLTP